MTRWPAYISANLFSAPFFEVLYKQSPPHEPLVLVVHSGQKCEWVVVCEGDNRQRTGPNICFKMLQCQQQSKGFVFNGGILCLVPVKFDGKITD